MIKLFFKQASFAYQSEIKIIDNFSFNFEKGKIYSILGPSGVGKTTLLNLIAGLTSPQKGKVSMSKNIKVGYIFQENRLLPWLSVKENLLLVFNQKTNPSKKVSKAIDKTLKLTKIDHKSEQYPNQLSAGEKQRVNIARALSINPQLILMDEPLSHLDEITAILIRENIKKILTKSKKITVFVSHNPLEAVYLSDKVLVVKKSPINKFKEFDIKQQGKNHSFNHFIALSSTQKSIHKITQYLNKNL